MWRNTVKSIEELRKQFPESAIKIAEDIHGHMSPGILTGFKMILYGLSKIDITPQDKIIITSENVRCLQDALFSLTHYLINENGWRIYPKVYDVGKLSIQIGKNVHKGIPQKNGTIFRVIIKEKVAKNYPFFYKWLYQQEKEKTPMDILLKDIKSAPDEQVFEIVPFSGKMLDFCHISSKNLVQCPICNESVEKMTLIEKDGQLICRVCAFFEKL
jgi:formylmethanofuran dehydrogenase subunit E